MGFILAKGLMFNSSDKRPLAVDAFNTVYFSTMCTAFHAFDNVYFSTLYTAFNSVYSSAACRQLRRSACVRVEV